MTPSRLAATLRFIAAKIDNSKKPRRDLVSHEIHRILMAMEVSNIEVSDSFEGPWVPSDEGKISAEAESRFGSEHYLNNDGVLLYFKYDDNICSIASIPFIHAEDAQAKFLIQKLDEDGNIDSDDENFPFEVDDLKEVFAAI
jgi:hypothetical protein